MKTYITRTVSYYNDETSDLRASFKQEYPTAQIELIDDDSISGVIIKEYLGEFESVEQVKNYVCLLECIIGECFSVYDDNGIELFTEEFSSVF